MKDPGAGRRAARHALLVAGLLVAPPAGAARLFVVCQGGDAVSVIDTQAAAETARIPVAKAPAGIAFAPGGTVAYVTHPDAGRVSRIDAVALKVEASARVGGQPFGVASDPTGDALYVSDWSGDKVVRLDPRTLARTGEVAVGQAPAGLSLDAARRRLYSADRESNAVSIIDLDRFTRIASVPVGGAPYALEAGVDPERVAVADVRGADVALIDTADLSVARVPGPRMPYGVAFVPGRGLLLATDQQGGGLAVIDPAAARVLRTVRIGGAPEGVVADPDGRTAYVAQWFANTVAAVDLGSLSVTARIPVCDAPRTMALQR